MSNTEAGPALSVVVPVYQGSEMLPRVLTALARSTLPRTCWELIVVDDGSTDSSASVAAQWADRVIRLPGPPGGPGRARNHGVREARAEWVLFVDADVAVHPATLERVLAVVRMQRGLVAVFGAYDDHPQAPGLVSQYRNLLHRYVHLQGAGIAKTFWAGCGAVSRNAFLDAGGFDTIRFPRPQVEDIELGYRLGDRGGHLLLDPGITGTHLKSWTLRGMLRTDVLDRGVPWMRLLLERRGRAPGTLNTTREETVKVAMAGLAGVLLPVGLLAPGAAFGAAALAGLLILANIPFLRWVAGVRDARFAAAVIPLHLLHYGSAAVAGGLGILQHALTRIRGSGPARPEPAA